MNDEHILISLEPRHAENILAGRKTVELRRRFPIAEATGATALIYSSSPVKAIVGCVLISGVLELPISEIWKTYGKAACVSKKELYAYFAGKTRGFVLLLRDVRALESNLTADHLQLQFGFVPPQSFRYLGNEYNSLLRNEQLQAPHRHKHRYRA